MACFLSHEVTGREVLARLHLCLELPGSGTWEVYFCCSSHLAFHYIIAVQTKTNPTNVLPWPVGPNRFSVESSCLCLLSTSATGVHHHAWLQSLESLNVPPTVFSPLREPSITLFLNGRSVKPLHGLFFLIADSESKTRTSGTSGSFKGIISSCCRVTSMSTQSLVAEGWQRACLRHHGPKHMLQFSILVLRGHSEPTT